MGIFSILSDITRIAANLTGSKRKKEKWKKSNEAKELKKKKEDNKFYNNLEKGNSEIIDVIRKEKQKRIKELKRTTKIILVFFMTSLLIGCVSIPNDINLAPSALKTTEKTYSIKRPQVLSTSQGSIQFDKGWHVVYKDYIKEHNENQNDLIQALERNNKITIWRLIAIGTGSTTIILLMVIAIFLKNRK